MKFFLVTFILFFFLKTTHAQITVPVDKRMIDNIQKVKPNLLKENYPQAKILYTTDKGTVYSLPLDNMPCLVPDIKSHLPVQKLDIHPLRRIPNALPEYKIIPGTELPGTLKIPQSNNKKSSKSL